MSANDVAPDYAKSALLVWDMVYGIAPGASNFQEVLANTKKLIGSARSSGVPVFYSQHAGLPPRYQSKFNVYTLKRRGLDPTKAGYLKEGTHDWEIIAEVAPVDGDTVIKKYTPSFFIGTNLEQMLRNSGVETVIIVGVATEIGVEATARHAAYLGFIPVVVSDAVGGRNADLHAKSLDVMRSLCEVQTTDYVIRRITK